MSSLQTLKQFVNDRLVAAAEEIFGVFQQTVSELENELNRQREQLDVFLKQPGIHLQPLDVQELRVTRKEDSSKQDWRPSLDLEDPEPPNNTGEKQEYLDLVQVKSEDEVQRDEEPSTSSLIRHIKTEADEFNCGGSEPELFALYYSDHQKPLSSECDTDDGEDLRETNEVQSDSNSVSTVHISEKKDDTESLKLSVCGRSFSKKPAFTCSVCLKCFKTRQDLENHMRVHTGEKPFSCSYCGKCFSHKSNLLKHTRIHTGEKPYSCSDCGKCFTQSGELKGHIRRVHTGEKPYSCSYCGKCFTQSGDLKMHIKRIHTGEKPNICSHCGKCYAQSGDLKVHIRRVHTGEKPFTCSHCAKCFIQNRELQVHIRRNHTGEKPYICSHCGKCFTQSSELKVHIRNHTGEKPFSCSFCCKQFTQKASLQSHIKVHT